MKISHKVSVSALAVSLLLGFALPVTALAATAPDLGVAANYSVFGSTAGITETAGQTSHLWGDVGDNGFGHDSLIASQVAGTLFAVTQTTVANAIASAYGSLSQTVTGPATTDLAASPIVTPGVYNVAATSFNSTLTLNGAGVYIFRSTSSIAQTTGGTMVLTGGATACNVFWQIPTAMTFGSAGSIAGTIITNTGNITFVSGVNLQGRAWGHTQVTMSNNQITQPTCTVASGGSVQNGTIKVVKTVINDNGGTKTVADFPLFVNGTSNGHQLVLSGETNTFLTNGLYPYTVTETSDPNYTATFSGDCDVNGFLNLAPGDHKTCTITNNDKVAPVLPATITVVKTVINDNGGTRTVASFPLSVSGTPVVSGVTNTFPVGTYTVNEIGASNYTRTFSGDCDSNGVMSLIAGANKTCSITNTYIRPVTTTTTTTTTTTPKLPNTGLPSQGRTPWDIFISAGILMLVSTSLVLALKKYNV